MRKSIVGCRGLPGRHCFIKANRVASSHDVKHDLPPCGPHPHGTSALPGVHLFRRSDKKERETLKSKTVEPPLQRLTITDQIGQRAAKLSHPPGIVDSTGGDIGMFNLARNSPAHEFWKKSHTDLRRTCARIHVMLCASQVNSPFSICCPYLHRDVSSLRKWDTIASDCRYGSDG